MTFPITEHTVKTARHTTGYLACGPQDGPLLVFVHGWPELSRSWRHQLPALAALGFRCVAPDMRGYNLSSKPAAGNRAVKPEVVMAYMEVLKEKGWMHTPILQRVDPPEHGKSRKILNRVFTPAQVKSYVPEIDGLVNMLVDSILERGECEFVKDFALPLPGRFIARHLGLNDEEYPRFRRWAEAMLWSQPPPKSFRGNLTNLRCRVRHGLEREPVNRGARAAVQNARSMRPPIDCGGLRRRRKHEHAVDVDAVFEVARAAECQRIVMPPTIGERLDQSLVKDGCPCGATAADLRVPESRRETTVDRRVDREI